MTKLAFERQGVGAPLVLLHGIGSCRQAWDPVLARLTRHFEVIAIDLPGFGESEPLSGQIEPTPAALASAIDRLLIELGIVEPHVVGNSLGGWVALELASLRPLTSLTLLSPAGLWAQRTPAYARLSLRASHWLARHAGGLLSRLVRFRVGRLLILGQTHGRPTRMTTEQARMTIGAMGGCIGFGSTLAATNDRRYLAATAIDLPTTLAFGSRDFVLLAAQSRHLDQLPSRTRSVTLPGCGHLPMFDDPLAVSALIVSTAAAAAGASSRP
jgi:pimeloyl-ACP methyl ester carboxylesterase